MKTGVMSTGMSDSLAMVASISAFPRPYFSRSALARAESPVASIIRSSLASERIASRNFDAFVPKRPPAAGTIAPFSRNQFHWIAVP